MLQSDLRGKNLRRVPSAAAALGLLGLLACRDSTPEATPAATPRAADSAAATSSYELVLPTRWTGHYRVDSLSTQERGLAKPGALNFVYLPSDSAIRPQTLLVIAVYDSSAWRAVLAEGGPPPGDSVAAKAGLVYIVGLPQSNPFPPATADAIMFDLLKLRPNEVAGLVRPR